MKNTHTAMLLGTVFFSTSLALAEPPAGIQGNVTIVNEESDPVPVVIQNSGQGEPVQVFSAPPEFYKINRTVFGISTPDGTATVNVTERVILYEVMVQTTTIHQVAGCVVRVSMEAGGSGGPISFLFDTRHFDKDTGVYRDGQTTQQRLGAGVVIVPGDNIVIEGGHITNPDISIPGPDAFCSSQVQLFGEILPD
jgi:hypothetical protein